METTTTTGSGAVTLAGAVAGYRTFAAAFATQVKVYYGIASSPASGGEWEVGEGYLSDATTFVRDKISSSSNSGSAVSLSAGTKVVYVTFPAYEHQTKGNLMARASRLVMN